MEATVTANFPHLCEEELIAVNHTHHLTRGAVLKLEKKTSKKQETTFRPQMSVRLHRYTWFI